MSPLYLVSIFAIQYQNKGSLFGWEWVCKVNSEVLVLSVNKVIVRWDVKDVELHCSRSKRRNRLTFLRWPCNGIRIMDWWISFEKSVCMECSFQYEFRQQMHGSTSWQLTNTPNYDFNQSRISLCFTSVSCCCTCIGESSHILPMSESNQQSLSEPLICALYKIVTWTLRSV